LFDRLFGKKLLNSGGPAYSLECELHPLRLQAHKPDYLDLEVAVSNQFDRELLTSIVIQVPRGLGFEQSALSQEREIRLGMLRPGESKRFKVPVWATQRTEPGHYPVRVHAISHFHDYGYVLNEVRREVGLRAV
jgi:uncharacterized membrane protein